MFHYLSRVFITETGNSRTTLLLSPRSLLILAMGTLARVKSDTQGVNFVIRVSPADDGWRGGSLSVSIPRLTVFTFRLAEE